MLRRFKALGRAAMVGAFVLVLVLVLVIGLVAMQVQHNARATPAIAPPGLAQAGLLEKLHAACVTDMVASTCKVMGSAAGTAAVSGGLPPSAPGELMFIAGVGPIAASDYRQMYEAGDAMCSVVRKACADDWTSGRCQTARKLLLPGSGV